jgi:hypothetical protein
MPIISWEQMKQLLKDAVDYPGFVGSCSILQDGITQANLHDHIVALRPGVQLALTEQSVQDASVTGLVTLNRLDRQIEIAAGDPAPAENLITFDAIGLVVPHRLVGWDYDGDLDTAEFTVRARWADTDPWRRIQPRDDFAATLSAPPGIDQDQVSLSIQVKVDTLVAPRVLRDLVLFLEHM